MSLRRIVAFTLLLVIGVTGWFWWPGRDASSPPLATVSPPATVDTLPAAAADSLWGNPAGAYDLTVSLDQSGSISPADLVIGRALIDSVATRVRGKNRLQVAEFATTFRTHGQAEGEKGINELLGRWHESFNDPLDPQHTNLTLALKHLVQRAVPVVESGFLTAIIIITDGDHDPPLGYDDSADRNAIRSALEQVPQEKRDKLRLYVIEVGDEIKYSGAVRSMLLRRAETYRAADWAEVEPIVAKLQRQLSGSFSLVNAPRQWRIDYPESDEARTVGPFEFRINGPDSVSFQPRIVNKETQSGRPLAFIQVNHGPLLPFWQALYLRKKDQVGFVFKADPANPPRADYFSTQVFFGKEEEHILYLEPVGNAMPFENLDGHRVLQIKSSPLWMTVALWLGGLALVAGILIICVIYRLCRRDPKEEEMMEMWEGESRTPKGLRGWVQLPNEETVTLSGFERTIDDCFSLSRTLDEVRVLAFVPLAVKSHGQDKVLSPDDTCLLSTNAPVELRRVDNNEKYVITFHAHAQEVTVG